MDEPKPIPIMPNGRYAGIPVDQIPNSYLRWVLTQNFPDKIVEVAKFKLESSDYSEMSLHISRHAIDEFSKRFLTIWLLSEGSRGKEGEGMATFMTKMAEEAWKNGLDKSKYRHQDDGIIRNWRNILWVFQVNPIFPEYRSLITVMPCE